jgi:hypothetical protein
MVPGVYRNEGKLTAPPHKSVSLARPKRDFAFPCIILPLSHPPPMRPRTILDIINKNRGVNNELTPNQCEKIEDVITVGANFAQAAKVVNYNPETARKTILLASKRQNKQLKSRPGRPLE